MTRILSKVGLAAALTAAAALTLAGCAGGSSSGGTLDTAACDALLSSEPAAAPAAAPAESTAPVALADFTAGSATVKPAVAPTVVKAADDDKKNITFVGGAYTSTTEDYWKNLAAKFAEANPGYTVDVQIIDWNNIDQQVATMIQTQQYPDILNQNKYSGWAANGLLQDASAAHLLGGERRLHPRVQGRQHPRRDAVRTPAHHQHPRALLQQGTPSRRRASTHRPPRGGNSSTTPRS